ncbi:precorrin-2 dehydrogenase/sirohydrochlorin ferrochelatase family protein [Vibrio astriarenae]|uniref:precorrin-2 dehydrogenase/sirohydrochlorin ferrochelatase family protein n=1 Tax=Vibrio astriarenae TaxID=1481923 RepID=UPI003735A461
MQYFPLFMKLIDKPVLVVGGGEVACRKVEALLKANARVTIISPHLDEYLSNCVEKGLCYWVEDTYKSEYLSNDLIQVWATTDSNEINHAVYHDAKQLNLMVNVVDDQPYCDFITPSMITRGNIQIAVSSGGASPVLVRNIRQTLESHLPQNMGLLADFAASKRDDIKSKLPSVDLRRVFWECFFAMPEVMAATTCESLDVAYEKLVEGGIDKRGSLTLIQLPKAVDLLTLRSLQALQKAELVLYPADCDYAFVDIARRDAERAQYTDIANLLESISLSKESNICVYLTDAEMEKHLATFEGARLLYNGH